MDKSNLPPASTTAALKALNKSSYKISKQSSSSSSSSSMRAPSPPPPPLPSRLSPPLPAPPPPAPPSSAPIDHPPPQPPVYNIDKSNFRDVVQKLTGSPSHLLPPQPPAGPAVVAAAAAAPPPSRPLMAPPPLSAIPSRLHRIRPPPLAPPRPPPILPAPAPAPGQPTLSPLPALPSVCMSAESPISAYMRRLRGMPSPIHVPTSPLGFGCLHSPRAPTSPGVAMPATSPRVRDQ